MKKALLVLVVLAFIVPLVFASGTGEKKGMKIAFFVSDMSNVFHQGQFTEAKKYAKEKYGAEVFAFDGKSDSAVMTQNIDQIVAQGMDAATLHIWDAEAAKPGVLAALAKGIISSIQVLAVAWANAKYMTWQVRRDEQNLPIRFWEYGIIAVSAAVLIGSAIAVVAAMAAAFVFIGEYAGRLLQ